MDDARYKQLMVQVGMPNSHSLLAALEQVANEVEQEVIAREREKYKQLLLRNINNQINVHTKAATDLNKEAMNLIDDTTKW